MERNSLRRGRNCGIWGHQRLPLFAQSWSLEAGLPARGGPFRISDYIISIDNARTFCTRTAAKALNVQTLRPLRQPFEPRAMRFRLVVGEVDGYRAFRPACDAPPLPVVELSDDVGDRR